MDAARRLTHISHDNVRLAVDSHARDHAYHPVLDYLESLRWDDTARLDTWLTNYLASSARLQSERSADVSDLDGRASSSPAASADHMMVLEGRKASLSRPRATSGRRPGSRIVCRTSQAAKMLHNICAANG
jgi:predicted P-loop ATPase